MKNSNCFFPTGTITAGTAIEFVTGFHLSHLTKGLGNFNLTWDGCAAINGFKLFYKLIRFRLGHIEISISGIIRNGQIILDRGPMKFFHYRAPYAAANAGGHFNKTVMYITALNVFKSSDTVFRAVNCHIYELVLNSITTRGENPLSAMTQDQCVDLVSTAQKAADEINLQMRIIAETIPEYKVLRSMAGVGDRLGPIILGEIGDIRRFHSGKALNAYAGNDAPPYQSGQFESRNRHISKRGNPALRKACFEVMQALKLTKPQDDPVYLFLLKKEQEGKPYNVAKMAAVNKFLRIYYARAMELYK